MNKEDIVNAEIHGLRGLEEYEKCVEFALDCITMGEIDWAVRALKILKKDLELDVSNHGGIMVD